MKFEIVAGDFLVVDCSLLFQSALDAARKLSWCPAQFVEIDGWTDLIAINPNDWYGRYKFVQLSYLKLPSRFLAKELRDYLERNRLCLMPLSCLSYCVEKDLVPKGLTYVFSLVPIKYNGANLVFRLNCQDKTAQTLLSCAEYDLGRPPTAVLVGRLVEQELEPE